MAVTGAPMIVQKFTSIPSQGLGSIRRPLTASLDSNIRKVLKEGIKPKYGETPTLRSLRKLPKSGTHAKPSPRRAVLLLLPKTADGQICRKSREKSETFSLKPPFLFCNSYCIPFLFISHFFSFEFVEETTLFHFCPLVT